jgi:N-acetylglutamate synthase-like GNAT family acetyltransferase
MITLASEDHVPEIFSLLERTYKKHSMLTKGQNQYAEDLQKGKYVGLIHIENRKVIGHAGISINDGFGLINCLVTDKDYRKRGIGKQLFRAREEYSQGLGLDFLVGYSMMQHPFSQVLYSSDFFPIGMVIDYPDIYSEEDQNFNRGSSNAEMVLCKKFHNESVSLSAPKLDPMPELYTKILKRMGVKPSFRQKISLPKDKVFLGIAPEAEKGFFVLEFLESDKSVDFSKMITTNPEREEFKNEIKKTYQKNLVL